MYILELNQNGMKHQLGIFGNIKEGREFISQLDAYYTEIIENELYESIDWGKIPEYVELSHKGNIVLLTRYMFPTDDDVAIVWNELPLLSQKGDGIVEGYTQVDAYYVENKELKDYIMKRENKYLAIKEYLEKNNCEITRKYRGSEDGEAIFYKDGDGWKFLLHMDPDFVENMSVEKIIEMVKTSGIV